jgi:hypothetical protein
MAMTLLIRWVMRRAIITLGDVGGQQQRRDAIAWAIATELI